MNPALILHPLSYSPSGTAALSKALALARLYHADLHILLVRARRVFSHDPIVRPISDRREPPKHWLFTRKVRKRWLRLGGE